MTDEEKKQAELEKQRIEYLLPEFRKEYEELCAKYEIQLVPVLIPKDNFNLELRCMFAGYKKPPEGEVSVKELGEATETAKNILSPPQDEKN